MLGILHHYMYLIKRASGFSHLQLVKQVYYLEYQVKENRRIHEEILHAHSQERQSALHAQIQHTASKAAADIIKVAGTPTPEVINPILEYWYGVRDA